MEQRLLSAPQMSDYALVYLIGANGFVANLFVLTIEDAKKVCSDEKSARYPWLMMWTQLAVNNSATKIPLKFVKGICTQNDDFERLGIKKPSLRDCRRILNMYGYRYSFI